jgi:hypothetical protein
MAWVHAQLCKLQKGCTRLAAASEKGYQLLAHGPWFFPGTLAKPRLTSHQHVTCTRHAIVEKLMIWH